MAAERKQNIVSSWPILAILAIIGGAYYLSQLPLESSRPESPLGLEHVVPKKDKIDARLWQDPFKVALDHEKAMHREKNLQNSNPRWQCTSNHNVHEQLVELISRFIGDERKTQNEQGRADSDVPNVHVLMIMVRDGNFAEDHERRLRNRYAVLTALYASGLTPEDSKHIQYFRLEWTDENELEEYIRNYTVPKIAPVLDETSRTIIVPFECFKRTELDPAEFKPECPDYAAVVWLPESAFSHRPLTRLAQVIDAIGHKSSDNVRIDVVGPSYSDTLLAMLKEIKHRDEFETGNGNDEGTNAHSVTHNYAKQSGNGCFVDVFSMLCDLTILSPWSTASPALLLHEAYPDVLKSHDSLSEMFEDFAKKFQDLGIKFLRTIGSDDLLAMELINELRRRGVDLIERKDQGNVALITEWDTFYGQAFPLTFMTMMKSIDPKGPNGAPDWRYYTNNLIRKTFIYSFPDNLHIYTYIRGIDGILSESQQSEETKSNQQTELESKWTYTKSLELPIGRSQLDYARRLAQDLKDKWEQSPKRRPAAIGLVGSDVYDKLILLHALREQFGNVIIFMTDLDARFMHHEQSKWTRNVIVSSNFDLKLHETYHSYMLRHLSPFRDNYQTSLFLACRAALGLCVGDSEIPFRNLGPEQLTEIISHPRLFEIGRGRAVDISVDNADIHPVRRQLIYDRIKILMLVLLAIAFCLLLLIQISRNVRKAVRTISPKRRDSAGIIAKALVVVLIGFVVVVTIDHYRLEGEPFSIITGVSIWPGEALRLIAAILSAFFIGLSLGALKESDNELVKDFGLDKFKARPSASVNKSSQGTKTCERLTHALWLRWRHFIERISILGWTFNKESAQAQRLWPDYLFRAKRRSRFFRLIPMAVTYVLFAIIMIWTFGPPYTPYRGSVARCVDIILLALSVVLMIVLMFLVVDATKLCLRVVYGIREYPNWAKQLTAKFTRNSALQTEDVERWLDVRFIGRLTEPVGKLIYYPFIVLFLMILTRSQSFDNWGFPMSLVIILLVYFFHAMGCAIALQASARKARRTAIGELQKTLHNLNFSEDRRRKQIEYLIEQIESSRQGAFRPFLENPVVHILIPSGGLSLITLLRFLLPS